MDKAASRIRLLACNDRDETIAFVLTGANVSDKDPNVFKVLARMQLVTGLRVNMKNKLMR